jgi:hypothetical protein
MRPDQNVYVLFGSKLKSIAVRRPVAPAMCSASPNDTFDGRPITSVATAAKTAVMITTICFTSVHVTACTPPSIV